ncbi:MAG: hypothetical protein KDC98_02440 [Planctomycetes bacterium]|nr:hypothetical protein [Planctomycetota bacterium]
MVNLIPAPMKKKLEEKCKKAASKVAKIAPGESNEKKIEKLLRDAVCKEVDGLDQRALRLAAEQLAKVGRSHSAKAANAPVKVDAKPTIKKPGSGVPSLTLPLRSIMLNERLGTKGKLALKIWADPRNLKNADKGVMLYFTVTDF